jgi:aspartate 1-decarboxylase
MLRTFCKSKISHAVITGKELHYNGSIGIDKDILLEADILPGEQVQVLNVNNGERIITYAIEEKSGSGKFVLYGPAVRRGEVGDSLVILSYCSMATEEYEGYKQKVVSLKEDNKL